jgi:hypothetical protein
MPDKRKPMIFPGQKTNTSEKFVAEKKGMEQMGRAEPPEGGWDANYVPGYSDERHYWESQGKNSSLEMPGRLQWIRATGAQANYRDTLEWSRKGYIVLKCVPRADGGWDPPTELAKHGWGIPPVAEIQENGVIRKGTEDAVLAYCDGEQARKNFLKEQDDIQTMEQTHGRRGERSGVPLESEEEREKVRLGEGDIQR